ncbi:MAG: hypothetical protein CMJ58_07385 [Planctomycetaceae bacterium]|nr:hypothetical protein [Planctomycetaceae bacterium]
MPSSATLDQVQAHFRRSSYPQMAAYVADVDNGVVTLAGEAPTYYAKQVVQTIAARCPGVAHVANAVEVRSWR